MQPNGPGTSAETIALHYDIPAQFYEAWLGEACVYSCAMWDPAVEISLAEAQENKISWYFDRLAMVSGDRLLDVGCGWGRPLLAAIDRGFQPTGLTLSSAQRNRIVAADSSADVRLEHWIDHEPIAPYDALLNLEALEHFVTADDSPTRRSEIYSLYFQRSFEWLRPGGRFGLQTFCFEDVGRAEIRSSGPVASLMRDEIFPEASPAHLSEIVLGWEPFFRCETFVVEPDAYVRTLRVWLRSLLANRERLETDYGTALVAQYRRYLAAGMELMRRRRWTLYRIVLTRRDSPKR
jgi:cyclopropane-fatty-acyl-phospholipid synthase